jgi:peptide-methionine (S)-S-oxide reductase
LAGEEDRMLRSTLSIAGAALLAGTAGAAVSVPRAALLAPATSNRETAIFAGGCFWGVEGVFEHVRGVIDATSGYAGGKAANASYERVGTGTTGHAEAVRVVFDPRLINYADLLRVYFAVAHDPTQRDRQGPDVGPQYRSALFPLNAGQEKVARAYIAQLQKARAFPRPIVTTIESGRFFPAEDYHQDFMRKNPNYPYVVAHDRPKIQALKTMFPQVWRG